MSFVASRVVRRIEHALTPRYLRNAPVALPLAVVLPAGLVS
jgi:hypothetical protein